MPRTVKTMKRTPGLDTLFGDRSGSMSGREAGQTIKGLAGGHTLFGDAHVWVTPP
jgi:hypothetical protein